MDASNENTTPYRIFAKALIMAITCYSLTGCGGGSSASTSTVTVASGASTTAAAPVAAPVTTAVTTPTPGAPTGIGSFSGRVNSERGLPLAGASVSVSVPGAQKLAVSKRSDARDALSVTTGDDGSFKLTGLDPSTNYELTVTSSGRKTLKTTFTLNTAVPDLDVILIAPKGSGDVSFEMPQILQFNAPVSHGTTVDLSWQPSVDPGFVAYVVYRSSSPGQGTSGTQITAKLAPNDVTYEDTLPQANQVFYYRMYEKLLIPEIGAFMLIGSNEVVSAFPTITSNLPVGSSEEVSTPVQVTFSTTMDHASVEQGLTISSDIAEDAAIQGQTQWNGNTFTFTPVAWRYARKYTISLSGLRDTNGDTIPTSFIWTFQTKSGYRLDDTFAATDLGKVAVPNAGYNIATNASDDIIFNSRRYSSQGALLSNSGGPFGQFASDAGNDLYVVSDLSTIEKFDAFGNSLGTFSYVAGNKRAAMALDRSAQRLYLTNVFHVQKFDLNGNALGTIDLPITGADIAGMAIGENHQFWTIQGNQVTHSNQGEATQIRIFDANFNPLKTIVLSPQGRGVGGIATDSQGFAYAMWTTDAALGDQVLKFDASGNLVTRFVLPLGVHAGGTQSIACDSAADLLVGTSSTSNTVIRYIPDP